MLKQHVLAAPKIVDRPPTRMAVIETVGDPDKVGSPAAGALYGSDHSTRAGFGQSALALGERIRPCPGGVGHALGAAVPDTPPSWAAGSG